MNQTAIHITLLFLLIGLFGLAVQSSPPQRVQAETPAATAALEAGTTRTDSKGVEQVWVPAGCFQMGTDPSTLDNPDRFKRELPQHEVCLSQGYWIDKYEVSVAAFAQFVKDGGYTTKDCWSKDGWAWLNSKDASKLPMSCFEDQPNFPRVCITWYEAEAYSHWRGGRLPTEAEWEFAARGPDSRIYPWGDKFDINAANTTIGNEPVPVDSHPEGVSWVGAYNMAGNAMEWVQDWLDDKYYELKVCSDPQGPATGTIKIEKGGWYGAGPLVSRSAYRHYEDPPTYQDAHIGVRILTPGEAATVTPESTPGK